MDGGGVSGGLFSHWGRAILTWRSRQQQMRRDPQQNRHATTTARPLPCPPPLAWHALGRGLVKEVVRVCG